MPPNDVKLRTRTDGNNIRLGESASITGALAVTLGALTLAASATVTTPAPAPTGPVTLSGLGLSVWNRWDG